MIDRRSYTQPSSYEVKLRVKKISILNGIRTHDLCDNAEVLYSN